MLELADVHSAYGDTPVVRGVSLKVTPGTVVALLGRNGMGKTTLAINIANHAALCRRLSVGVFSLEMTKEQLIKRSMAAESDVHLYKMNTGYVGKDDWAKLAQAAGRMSTARVGRCPGF